MQKVLIIKVGYSETLDPEISSATSYGDVMRSTVLLNLYKGDHVTWLVDEKAYPILKGNRLVSRVLIYNLTSVLQLQAEHFDTVINLEKVPGLCALADSIKAWRRYGFRFEDKLGHAEAYDGSHDVLSMCRDAEKKKSHSRYWQQRLFEMVGAQWQGEEYVMAMRPNSAETHDIGFNYQVGNKWPTKMWPMGHWQQLERLIGGKYSVSWQQGLEQMEHYFDWVGSCRMIVTNDSFGLHLALALKKKVLAIFGPTNWKEHYLYGLGKIIVPEPRVCSRMPCGEKKCLEPYFCLDSISPERVFAQIDDVFSGNFDRTQENELFANTTNV